MRTRRVAVELDIDSIARQAATIHDVLRRWRVPSSDRADIVQEVLLGAWQSMRAGRFQPRPGVPDTVALKRWIVGISWRHASHHVTRAHRRYEVLVPSAGSLRQDHAPAPLEQVEARKALGDLRRVAPRFRAVLALTAQGYTIAEIAAALGHNPNTVWNRLRLGRRWFRRVRRRWRMALPVQMSW
ncbi:sigma-70 family RNA polymerase sigma factor [Sorangium sp. So ce136]|uniref:RNA polymerase sigma factor n=1 Tax=Sorangium sp. So ce136 TaxID=3133284 RepID=UPI003F04692A